MVVPEQIDRKFYPSFGECIYCGSKAGEVELTDEHIVPYSLGGNAWIKDGSCKMCSTETSKLERILGRNVLGGLRNHIGEQSRRKTDRPTEGTFAASINGGPPQSFTVPIDRLPIFTPMPVWGMPTILMGETPREDFHDAKAHLFYWMPPNIRQILGLGPTNSAKVMPPSDLSLDSAKFGRAIAKVASCQAILLWGLHGFSKLHMIDLILGRYPMVRHYVGSPLVDPDKPLPGDVKHGIRLSTITNGDFILHVAEVRLYGNSGTASNGLPVYTVVVGASEFEGTESDG